MELSWCGVWHWSTDRTWEVGSDDDGDDDDDSN